MMTSSKIQLYRVWQDPQDPTGWLEISLKLFPCHSPSADGSCPPLDPW